MKISKEKGKFLDVKTWAVFYNLKKLFYPKPFSN